MPGVGDMSVERLERTIDLVVGGVKMATVTIFLLRKEYKAPADALNEHLEQNQIPIGENRFATLYVKKSPDSAPAWAGFFRNQVDESLLGTVKSTSAVLFISIDTRTFALTFGHGRFLLKPECYEERFGLLATVNSVRPDALRSIDTRAFVDDQNARVQTGQEASAYEFGIDIERDLVRAIVGKPTDPALGSRLAGTDSLTASADVDISNVSVLLKKYLQAYNSTSYKSTFPWIDQIRQVRRDSKLWERLDSELITIIKQAWQTNGVSDKCWLSLPDIVEWADIDGFKFTNSKKEGVSTDVHLPGFVHTHDKDKLSIDYLKSHFAMAVNTEERVIARWPVYRCIQCEFDLDDKSYVLSAGTWFEIDKNFVGSIEKFYKTIPTFPEKTLVYNHQNEGKYNEALAASDSSRWCLMDRKLLQVGGVHDKIEFCDVYGKNTLFHIKHYGSSSVLGHLFNQGLVSGELLKSHPDVVNLANEKLDKAHKLGLANSVPRDVSAYSIVFGIISQSNKPGLHLPFFSKVVLKSCTTKLRDLGYKVLIGKIECDPSVLVKKVAPTK